MEFASKVVERVVDFVLELGIKHVAYIVRYRQNVDELNDSVKRLEHEKEKVEHQVDEAEKNLHNIEGKVTEWFRKVAEFETKVEEFGKDEGHTKTRLPFCLFPYLRNRHRLGRQAKKMVTEDVKKLIDELPKSDEIAFRQNVTSNDATLSNAGYVGFGCRKSTMEDIMAQLEDSTVRMIGLYGPGGVGKSTLIKEIAKKARDKKLFNVVAISEITANPNPQKIQEDIAYVLGLRLEGEGENVRADCLRRRLKKEKENTLVILDDLWGILDLNNLGIPLDGEEDDNNVVMEVARDENQDDPGSRKKNKKDYQRVKKEKSLGDYTGCKILLTSRDKKVLSDYDKMDVKSIFCVKELDDKDALMLFQKVAGIPHEMSIFKQEIVKKYCAGLPMAIATFGRALRDKSESVWEATLEKLKKQVGVQNCMDIPVKMSYDHLENEELKSIFLLCAQMGHQPLIMDLVKYCFGLGILEGVYSLREARDRIDASIQKLKDSSLMLDGSSRNHFKMHDMVRDAALSIAHKEQNVFTLRNGKLDDWPELERCTSISICNSEIIDELPIFINCPQLKFFQINSDDPSLKIPDSFFKEMEKLRVLILIGFHLSSLPSSIKCLSNLRMLCLERCTLDGDLSIVGELKKLRILSFSGSQIENLPDKLGCIDRLQLLDISNCSRVKMIPPNVISRLTCLEELYIRKSWIETLVEGETNKSKISLLSELKHLHQLKVVDLCIPCAAVLPMDLFFDKLNDYKIVIGDFRTLSVGDFRMPNKYEEFRSLALQLKDDIHNIHSQNGIKLLFKRVENLLLGELNGVENVIYELNLDGFPALKHLSITNNFSIKYIINSMDLSHPQNVFPSLESLCLYELRKLEMICCSPVTDASLTILKTIKVDKCAQLKNLVSFYMLKVLASLETIDVSDCDSLKEIVEILVDSDKVEFLKLRSVTLQSLPSFSSFYTKVEGPSVPQRTEAQTTNLDHIEITIAEDIVPPLFGELVEIPNLESLHLSSLNIHKIWSDQPLSSYCFQNIIKLVVKDCNKLKYLCSLSVASGLRKLKGLTVSGCRIMEKIFSSEGNSADKVCVFPKLEEIHLSEMTTLKDIWQAEVSADSFSSLISVHIEKCGKLDKIFPGHMEGWFASLNSLKVDYCESVEVIFEIKDSQQIDASGGIDTNIQHIHLHYLPSLKQVWSRDPGGILNFQNLLSIEVSSCDKLRNVFPASVAKNVPKLEHMSVEWSDRIVEIVADEDGSETNNEPLVFPELTYMQLVRLSNIKRFYRGRHPIGCPKLKKLAVEKCEKLKIFRTETSESTNEEEKAVFSAEKVFPNLECMRIGFDEAQKWLSSNIIKKYRMHCLKELIIASTPASVELKSLYQFLYRMPNLEKLSILYDSSSKEFYIVPQERLGTVLQLKEVVLLCASIKALGFERDPVLQRLELLSLQACHGLINLAPPSVSLTYLTSLEVSSCRGLRNLIASSTAKSLVQLKTMKVIGCDKIEQIVTNEGNKEDKMIEIVFSKLITIELVTLKRVTSFCTDKNCKFKFPSLEILIVRECPMMETFTESVEAPKLQNILAVEGEEEAKWQWEGDLNATIEKKFEDKVTFTYRKHLDLSNYPEFVEQLWQGNHLVQQNCFRNLKRLTAHGCMKLVHVIPSHLLHCFENLEELRVWGCSAVEVIFNINEIRDTKALGITRLKRLILQNLPKLEHVWDKDAEGIIGLQVLQSMRVEKCDGLKSLFPTSVAKNNLTRLEVLEVKKCRELVEIFSKDEKTAEGATEEFVFSCLTSLTLTELPGLKHFYPGLHILEWPVLEELHAFHCELVKLKCQEDHPEERVLIQIDQTVILMDQIPSLKQLSFGIGDTKVTWHPESGQLQFGRMERFPEESDSGPLYRFLDMMGKLAFEECLFEEMFSAQRPNADYTRILLHLKELQVNDCGSLINLVPCAVSFSNLTYLEVSRCKSLKSLFATSTAKSMARLKRVKIKECESLKEIVSREEDESPEDEQIIFEQLQVLYLQELHQLSCFYPGNFTLHFPSLEEVYVIECSWMKTFSPVNKIDHSINWFSAEDATPQQKYCDLNSAASRRWEELFLESARSVSELSLRDSPLQEIWQGSLPIPDLCFTNLNSFIVDGCQFLKDAVLPFNLLPFLTKLETLEVQNCDSVKTIFDVKRITQNRIMTFALKKLTLLELPNLENVWNEDPHGILSMQLLQQVYVDNCKCLTSVFPASVAKDLVKLENLVVEDCEGLMTIVAEDNNADPRGTNLELTFPCPCVRSLELQGLPKFKYFYYCSLECDILKTFTHTEDQVCIEKQKCLSLGEIGLEMIWRGEFQRNLLHKLKVLTLCFGSFKEIFCFQSPNVDENGLLSQLKVLSLRSLSDLETIGSENTLIQPFVRNLETLEVSNCSSLKNLVPCTVSFSNLTYLLVDSCNSLLYLFTSSTAKSLAQLKRMEIKSCDSIEEIVSKEGYESREDEIIFPHLDCLNLENLPKITSFYRGSLSFSSLDQLTVTDCEMMETLCPGTLKADKLFQVKFRSYSRAIPMEIDLKFIMRKKFLERILVTAASKSYLELRDGPLQEIWLGSLPIPDWCFSNLHSLTVDGCQFLTDAVLPFKLLSFLTKLETLKVRNCDSVKTIFDVKCTTQDRIKNFALKKLTLLKLPNLENVWNEDPHGILSMRLLQQVYVDNCKCLTSVFPASVAKDLVKLEDLVVQHCEGLMAIVAEDNADPRGANLELTFPCMTSLTLRVLPKFEFQVCNEKVSNIEKLEVSCCSFKRIFKLDDTGLVSQLKVLSLESLSELETIGLENTTIEAFLRNLETLDVSSCSGLTNLAPSPVCFPNLVCLFVFECHGLENLFTSSTAKSLARLKMMEIKSCESIKEIVSMEEDGSHKDEITFWQLLYLNLESLPNLTSFYTGSLSFPSLVQLSVINCFKMESLCAGTVNAEKLFEVKFQKNSDAIPLEIDLNSTILKACQATFLESARTVSELSLRGSPLQVIWQGSLPIPDLCFTNLHSLIVDGCPFLKDVVLPSNLLPFLTKLETLEVRNCDSVKTIFDVKSTTQDRIMSFALKNLTLLNLPNLENVWNEDPHADPRGTNLELTFPCITSLTLWGLPKFGFQVCIEKVSNIEKLEVSCCSFKRIFKLDDTGLVSQLKVLSLESLSELETIGLENTTIEEFLRNLETLDVSSCSGLTNLAPSPVCFPNLVCLFVFECHGLENLFTSSTAKSLARLKMMEIKSCESIKEIVSMEEDGHGSHKDEITFWQLLYLNLESLPNLTSFYTGSLSFPSLVQLSVINCHKMENLCAGTVNAEKLFGIKFQKNSDVIPLEIDLNSTIQATVPGAFIAFDYLSSICSDNEDREYGED